MKFVTNLFILFLVGLPAALAQTHGHPGGGGPDGNIDELSLSCINFYEETQRLEREFVSLWNLNHDSSESFFSLVDKILVEYSLKSIELTESRDIIDDKECEKEHITKPVQGTLAARVHYQKELAILKSIDEIWGKAKKGMKNRNICQLQFRQRSLKREELKLLIELYETNGK